MEDHGKLLVIIPSDPIPAASLLSAASESLRLEGSRMTVEPISMHHPQLRQRIADARTRGVVAMGCNDHVARAIGVAARPAVATHNLRWHARGIPVVAVDDRAAGEMAAEHFIARGLRHLAFVGCDQSWSTGREAGFVRAATFHRDRSQTSRAQIAVCSKPRDPDTRYGWDALMRRGTIARWIATLQTPVGIFACNDQVAARVVAACLAQGLRIPEDVSIVGADNDLAVCSQTEVSLSSVEPDVQRMGLEAARLLLRLMRGQPRPASPILVRPRRLEVRRSSDLFAFPNEDLNAALQYIARHVEETITLEELVKAVNVSRAKLHRLFTRHLGHAPGTYIRQRRLFDARNLLHTTNWDMITIATRCGFGSQSYFAQAFRRAFGESPSEFRAARGRVALR